MKVMEKFTLDFSRKITICAMSEEELAERYREMLQARIAAGQQFVECKMYLAMFVPVTKDDSLESGHNSFLGCFCNKIASFFSKRKPV